LNSRQAYEICDSRFAKSAKSSSTRQWILLGS
jgi:hypothetical protein